MYRIFVFAIIAITGCSGNSDDNKDYTDPAQVYIDRQKTQCNSDGTLPTESADSLISAGIDVLSTSCGERTGVVYPAVCGGGTSAILIHEIRREAIPDAEKIGYRSVDELVNDELQTGYKIVEC